MNARGRCAIAFFALLLTVPAFAANRSWTGAGGNALWSNPANWQGNVAPSDGDDLVFTVGDTPTLATTNDFPLITLHSIAAVRRSGDLFIHGTAEIGGNAFRITGSLGNNLVIDTGVTLAASQSWIVGGYPAASLVLNGTVNMNGYTLTTGGNKNTVVFNGDVAGTGAIVLSGACDTGGVTFNGHVSINGPITQVCGPGTFTNTNSFTGPITLTGSINNDMQVVDVSVAGAFPSGVQVLFTNGSSGQLKLGPNTLTQPSLSGSGSIRLNGGSVNLTDAPNTTFQGVIYGPGTLHVTGGNQTLGLADAMTTSVTNNATLFIDGATVSGGATTVSPGTLKLRTAHLDTLDASGGTLSVLQGNSATSLTLNSSSNFVATLGTGQITVSGNVSIGNSALTLTPEAQPQAGATYKIIGNSGAGTTSGTFAGYPEGAIFTLNGVSYSITYHGGSGKDVVITFVGTATQTSLSSNPNPSTQGNAVTLFATVTSSGNPVTTGNVTFLDGSTPLTTNALDSAGHVAYQTSSLSPGAHSLTARFNGSGSFAASTSAVVTQVVHATAPTQTTLTASPNPSTVNQPVRLTATVSGSGNPTGSVTFYDGPNALRTVTLNAGSATFITGSLSVGSHTLYASYSGDDAFSPSISNDVTQVVKGGLLTQTSLTTLDDTTQAGEPVTFKALVQSAFGVPDGDVFFADGSTTLAVVPLDPNGDATFTTSALSVGTHLLVATFQPASGFTGSSAAVTQHVLGDCPFPIFAVSLHDTFAPMHSDTTLAVGTLSGEKEQFAWFSGRYPDTSQPLAVTGPSLVLHNLEATAFIWVRVTNTCGTVFSAATITVPTPPIHRAIRH